MGTTDFYTVSHGRTLTDAFCAAQVAACRDYGSSGYTGTVAEKNTVQLLGPLPKLGEARTYLRGRIKAFQISKRQSDEWERDRLDYNIAVCRDYIRDSSRDTHTPEGWARVLVDIDEAHKHGPALAIDLTPKLTGRRKPKSFLLFGLSPC